MPIYRHSTNINENFVIFVKDAIPGQKVLAKIYRKKSGFAEARVLTLLTESSNAVEVKCNHYYIFTTEYS